MSGLLALFRFSGVRVPPLSSFMDTMSCAIEPVPMLRAYPGATSVAGVPVSALRAYPRAAT